MDQRLVISFVLLVAVALPSFAQEPIASPSSTIADLPRHVDYSREIGAAIKAEATAETDADRIAAVRWMARLYLQLKRDPRIFESETLRGYKARLWGRLNLVQKRWEREVARLERELGRNASQAEVQLSAATASISHGLDLVAATLGGPAAILACGCETEATHATMGGAARLDYGRELIELIQRTISPDFWDVNGGPGTIVYYAPLRVLVVRATAEVHDRVGGVLGDLR